MCLTPLAVATVVPLMEAGHPMPVLRTCRSKALAIVNGVVGGVLLPVLSIGTIEYDAPKASPANRVGTITFCVLVGAFVLLRVAPARLCVLLDGVRVVNYVRSRFIPWEAISGFSLRPWNPLWTPVGYVDLKDGSSVPVLGISRLRPELWPKRKPADDMIDELNRLLGEVRRGKVGHGR